MESIEGYLEALASAAPTPGGGSAATIVGAMAAALVAMVARITAGNAKYSAMTERAEDLITAADSLRGEFVSARLEDERAYAAVVDAMALPRSTDAEKHARTERLQTALAGAASAPLKAADLAVRTLASVCAARALENHNLMSDVDCAAIFARAALEASAANVRVNHRFMKDEEIVAAQRAALVNIERAFAKLYEPFGTL